MKNAAVIGLGTMGPGIAATLAKGGMNVRVFDVSSDALARAKNDLQTAFAVLERIGRPAAAKVGELAFETDLGKTVAGADLVVESVPEKPDIKAKVFADLDRLAPATAILASNTSGIPISKIQLSVARPARVIGMHWSNPPHVIPVIEVIAGDKTDKAVVGQLKDLISGLGLYPVVVKKDVPGFVENRVLYAIMRECLALAENDVIEPADLDTCVKWGIGFKLAVIGPLELLDVAGLDIYQAVASYLNADLDKRGDVSRLVTDKTAKGQLGMKTGSGIYSYTPEKIQQLRAARAAKLVGVRKTLEG